MSGSSRYRAFFSYLLGPPAALYVLLARRQDAFAVFHARQSLALGLVAVASPLIWAVVAWALAWIPLVGPMLGVLLFALLLALYAGLLLGWIFGLLYSWRGRARRIPLVGSWAVRRTIYQPAQPPESAADVMEQPAVHDA